MSQRGYVKDALKRLESGAGAAASGKGDGAALGLLPWPKVDFSTDPDIGDDHDPFTGSDCLSFPILRHEFDLMARYGRDKLQAAVFVRKKAG